MLENPLAFEPLALTGTPIALASRSASLSPPPMKLPASPPPKSSTFTLFAGVAVVVDTLALVVGMKGLVSIVSFDDEVLTELIDTLDPFEPAVLESDDSVEVSGELESLEEEAILEFEVVEDGSVEFVEVASIVEVSKSELVVDSELELGVSELELEVSALEIEVSEVGVEVEVS